MLLVYTLMPLSFHVASQPRTPCVRPTHLEARCARTAHGARCVECDDEKDAESDAASIAWRRGSILLKRRWIEPRSSLVVQAALERAGRRALLRRANATSLSPEMLDACLCSIRALRHGKVLILGNEEPSARDQENNASAANAADVDDMAALCGNFVGPLMDSASLAFARRVPIEKDIYWYRELSDGTPQLSLVDPLSGWKAAALPSGQEYFYNQASDAWDRDDMEVKMVELSPDAIDDDRLRDAEEKGVASEWQVGSLPSGKPYMWRSHPRESGEIEVRFWEEAMTDSGTKFWYSADSDEVWLTDPFQLDERTSDLE